MDAGVVFDVRAFCPQLGTRRGCVKDVDEVTLVNLDPGERHRVPALKRRTSWANSCPGSKDYGSGQSKLCSFRDLDVIY